MPDWLLHEIELLLFFNDDCNDCSYLSKTTADNKADIIIEGILGIKFMRASVASNIALSGEMAPVASRIAPRAERVTLAVDTGFRAECGIFAE